MVHTKHWTAARKTSILIKLNAPVAQGIEYWPPKPRVARSIRAGRAIFPSAAQRPCGCIQNRPSAEVRGAAARSGCAPCPMPESTPIQRTTTTARYLLAAGAVVSASAIIKGSIAGSLLAWLMLLLGGGMLMAARRAG